MGLFDFLRRRRPQQSSPTTSPEAMTAGAVGAAAIAPEGDVRPASDEPGGSGSGQSDTGAAGYDSGGGFEGGGGGGDSGGGGGGDSGGGGGG
jgi:hypothetical protein